MKHNRIIILAATAMAFAGCSSTDDLEGQSGKELKFTSDISAITPVKMETRASVLATSPDIEAMTLAEKDTILPENQILTRTDSWSARSTSDVAVQIGGGNVYKYTVDNNGVLSSSSTYYFTSLSDQTVAAWFPYSAAFSQFSVKGDQRTLANYNASDLLYATCTVNQNSTGNDLTFAHKTAKIIVNVTVENANYLLNSTINSVTLSGVNLTGSFSNGTLTATNTTGTVQMYNSSASTVTGTTAAATFEACVAPKSSTGDITVTVNVGGTNYTGTLSGGKNLRAGYGHNISVRINGDNVNVYGGGTNISIGDFYSLANNGQAVVVKPNDLSLAKSKGITPVALVFSTNTSTKDKQKGWNHGYAVALKNASEGEQWSTLGSTLIMSIQYPYSEYESAFTDYDGYSETHRVTDYSTYTPDNCPAFFAAVAYAVPVPKASSGWFLMSVGQWHHLITVLGKGIEPYEFNVYGQDIFLNSTSNEKTIDENINSYLSKTDDYQEIGGRDQYYWSSTEAYDSSPIHIHLYNHQHVCVLGTNPNTKTDKYAIRCAVAF
ncbi:MAG: fimbrillin family protein [Prevotella sp.]|nr:fimbrillin family protein [Prevotella sp.]